MPTSKHALYEKGSCLSHFVEVASATAKAFAIGGDRGNPLFSRFMVAGRGKIVVA